MTYLNVKVYDDGGISVWLAVDKVFVIGNMAARVDFKWVMIVKSLICEGYIPIFKDYQIEVMYRGATNQLEYP